MTIYLAIALTFIFGSLAVTVAVALSVLVDWWDHRRDQSDPLAIAAAVGVLRDHTARTYDLLEQRRRARQRRATGGAR